MWAGFAGLRPAGNPLIGFPFAKTSHRDVLAALPDLLGIIGGFRFLRKARRGAAPPPCQPFEKGWTENLFLLFLPTLRKNFLRVSTIVAAQPVARLMKLGARMMAASAWERRHAARAACRAANETWREMHSRGDMSMKKLRFSVDFFH